MKDEPEDPLFTTKGVILLALYGCIFAKLIFSMDPEWVGWAGPMALGALYVPNPPPPLFSDPKAAFEMCSLFYMVSALVLVFVSVIRGEEPFGLWSWFKAWLKKQLEVGVATSPRGT
jgi:hypothetical protein